MNLLFVILIQFFGLKPQAHSNILTVLKPANVILEIILKSDLKVRKLRNSHHTF